MEKTYMDHGFFNVPQKARFAIEMVNLVAMCVTFILNISLCFTEHWENQECKFVHCAFEQWARDQSKLPGAILAISIGQALVLIVIMLNSIYYWTKGG